MKSLTAYLGTYLEILKRDVSLCAVFILSISLHKHDLFVLSFVYSIDILFCELYTPHTIRHFHHFLQSPIERIQKQQEFLQGDVTKMKTRLKTLQTRTVRLEAMLKAILGYHGIDVKPEIDEDDAELKWDTSDDEGDRYVTG